MTEENMNKVYWIIACIVIVVALTTSIMKPAYTQINNQKSGITAIDFAPTK